MTGAPRIRVAIVDDDALVRAGLRTILSSAPDLEVVAEAADGSTVASLVETDTPDVIVMDIRMPEVDGIEATRRLAGRTKVLILTTFQLDQHVFDALAAGASGFLLKDAPPLDIIDAVRVVASGDAMLSPAHTRAVIDRFATAGGAQRRSAAATALAELSARELEVAHLVGDGLSNAEIGARLYCSEATVKTHLTHIFSKLGFTNRVRLAVLVADANR